MTNREFFEAIINGTMNDEIVAHAKSAIEKLDEKNAKRNNKPSKTQIENEPIKVAIVEHIGENEIVTATQIGERLEISTQKASALLRQLVADGKVTATEIKVPKKGKQKGYSLVKGE